LFFTWFARIRCSLALVLWSRVGPSTAGIGSAEASADGLGVDDVYLVVADDDRALLRSRQCRDPAVVAYLLQSGVEGVLTIERDDLVLVGEEDVNVMLNQMLRIAGQPISLQAGYRYYADAPDGGPDWGLRFTFTLLFPK